MREVHVLDESTNSTDDAVFKRMTGKLGVVDLKNHDMYSAYIPVPMPFGKKIARIYTVFVKQAKTSGQGGGPLMVWLNGGPGCSSLGGLFMGVGPVFVDRNYKRGDSFCEDNQPCKGADDKNGGQMVENPHSWHNHANLIFVETPPSVGFSDSAPDQISLPHFKKAQGDRYNPSSQEKLGMFHASMVAKIVETLEAQGLGAGPAPFAPVFLGGESFAGIYLGHMVQPMLQDKRLADRFGGVFLGNPMIGTTDRLDAALPALVKRGIVPQAALDATKAACPKGPFSDQVDFSAKQPSECTTAWLSAYDGIAQNVYKRENGGVSWYNSDYKCETCGGKGCPLHCFDTRSYQRLLNRANVQRALGVVGAGPGKAVKWDFCTDVSKWITDVPMVKKPAFFKDPQSVFKSTGKTIRFWLFSGDNDLESLHEVSKFSMISAFGEPKDQTPWHDADGTLVGDFLSFGEDAQLVRIAGGGHIPVYYATKVASELFKRFVDNDRPQEAVVAPCFASPVVDTPSGDSPEQEACP